MSKKKLAKPAASKSYLKLILGTILAIGSLAFLLGHLIIKGPELHGLYLRTKVGSKVYMIKGSPVGGGGTGFAVKAPSGESYILTNSHVCEGAESQSKEKGTVLVVNNSGTMRRRIIENSDFTDLCLVEGIPGESGLSVGDSPNIGEIQAIIGHPLLRPVSISRGEIVGSEDIAILAYIIKGSNPAVDLLFQTEDRICNLPKNHKAIVPSMFGDVTLCLNVTRQATTTTIVIFPGNSGSPMVDFWGRVTGVAFASDRTNWAAVVSQQDVIKFLSRY